MKMKWTVLLVWIAGAGLHTAAMAETSVCRPVLWPEGFTMDVNNSLKSAEIDRLIKKADQLKNTPPHPVKVLTGAGLTDLKNPGLNASRSAFKDADRAALLALAFWIKPDPEYLQSVRDILLAWALVNQPTGHPIDESRLAGMVWAYDLLGCHLSRETRLSVESWFERMRSKKMSWQFGPLTDKNNHRTHQLKMLLMLDRVLRHPVSVRRDLMQIAVHMNNNIDAVTGETRDYRERDALYYQNFDLQPWLEISLLTHCCETAVSSAFEFLARRIRSHKLSGEFVHSKAGIDKIRAKNGFSYAKKGGRFDVAHAGTTIAAYYTVSSENPPADLWSVVMHSKPSPWLDFILYRRVFWHSLIYAAEN